MRLTAARLAILGLVAASAAVAATPPQQPKSGPGGADYVAAEVVKRAIGRASAATYVFHAAGAPAEPRPVVVFIHAWGQPNPQAYGGWIEHLARKGNLVLFPKYQEVNRTRPADASASAAGLIKDALAALADDADAKPDLRKVAVSAISPERPSPTNLAASRQGEGPAGAEALLFALMPGGIASDPKSRGILLEDLRTIDRSTLIVTMSGDRDANASDRASRRIIKEAENVPPNRKLFMRARSDDHGFPVLSATLSSPGAAKPDYDAAQIKIPPDPPRDPKAPRERSQWRWTPTCR